MITPWAAQKPLTRQQGQRRRAVDQDEVVLRLHAAERFLQPVLAALEVDQFDLGAGEFAVGRQHVVAAARRRHAASTTSHIAEQHVVDRARQPALVDAAAHRRIALRIEIDQQHALPEAPGRGRDSPRSSSCRRRPSGLRRRRCVAIGQACALEHHEMALGIERRTVERNTLLDAEPAGSARDFVARAHALHRRSTHRRREQVRGQRDEIGQRGESARDDQRRRHVRGRQLLDALA